MVSEWRSVIAVSLNVGGGVRLIKPAKLCMCTQNTTNKTRTDARRRYVRQWFRTAELLGERRYEKWNTNTHSAYLIFLTPTLHTPTQYTRLKFFNRVVPTACTILMCQLSKCSTMHEKPKASTCIFSNLTLPTS